MKICQLIFFALLLLPGIRAYSHPLPFYKPDPACLDTPLKAHPDSILVIKRRREMLLFRSDTLLKVYHVSLGRTPVGPKHFRGDMRTPEGRYHIFSKNPQSECHKNLGISYPSDADKVYARHCGKATGGDVKIHGIINGYGNTNEERAWYRSWDWTYGCIAVTNEEIDELFAYIPVGTVINIIP